MFKNRNYECKCMLVLKIRGNYILIYLYFVINKLEFKLYIGVCEGLFVGVLLVLEFVLFLVRIL